MLNRNDKQEHTSRKRELLTQTDEKYVTIIFKSLNIGMVTKLG